MTLRRLLFWIHLTAGCGAGLVILMMSVTGLLLAYKRQVINWSDHSFWSQPVAGAQRVPLDALLATIQESEGRAPTSITVRADSAAPVAFDFGRERIVFVNPYSGRILGEAPRRPGHSSRQLKMSIAGSGSAARADLRAAPSPERAISASSFWSFQVRSCGGRKNGVGTT